MATCELVNQLSRLKKSSLEAVDDETRFDEFKQYMHVTRPIEKKLLAIIEETRKNNLKKLILLCGNAGDGKSNLIAAFVHFHGELMEGFSIHNDATASRRPDKKPEETLAEALEEFNDDHLDRPSDQKILLAVNLGTLSKFLDSAEGRKFRKLYEYVDENQILSDKLNLQRPNIRPCAFSHVSFCDYHVYTLEGGEAKSDYILTLLDKVFRPGNRFFYQAYEACGRCGIRDRCPVKANYEMMTDESVRAGIMKIIVEAVIKDKVILSTRALLNLFHDMIVHPSFSKVRLQRAQGDRLTLMFLEWTLPSLLFNHGALPSVLNSISRYDLLKHGSAKLDEIAVQFHIMDDIAEIFRKCLPSNPCVEWICSFALVDREGGDGKPGRSLKERMYRYFVRLYKVYGLNTIVDSYDQAYLDFNRYLYYTEKGDKTGLSDLYDAVNEAVFLWHGSEAKGLLNINVYDREYVIAENVRFKADLSFLVPREQTNLDEFSTDLRVRFKMETDESRTAELEIDYELYRILLDIGNGYKASIKDHSDFIRFAAFVRKIESMGDSQSRIIIKKQSSGVSFELKPTEFGYALNEV